jgi:hypothetical protein
MTRIETYLRNAQRTLDDAGFQRLCPQNTNARDVTVQDVEDYKNLLDEARDEKPLQRFFEQRPWMLASEFWGCRWVIPQHRLGSEFVPDFLVAHFSSGGLRWTLIELESPTAPLFTKNRQPRVQLRTALNQIEDWRSWLDENRSYARRQRRNGLGLLDITGSRANGLVLIGRREGRTTDDVELLGRHEALHRSAIHSYDWIIDGAHERIPFVDRWGSQECEVCFWS